MEDTTLTSAEVQCQAGYKCCLAVIATMVEFKETKTNEQVPYDFCSTFIDDYVIKAPKTAKDGGVEMEFFPCIVEDSENQEETDTLKLCPSE